MLTTAPVELSSLKPPLTRLFSLAESKIARSTARGIPAGGRRSSPPTAGTRPAPGRSGPRASSSARRCWSSTPSACRPCSNSAAPARARQHMLPHVTHTGVHDHGFNNVSTYGNLAACCRAGKIPADAAGWQRTLLRRRPAVLKWCRLPRWSGMAVRQALRLIVPAVPPRPWATSTRLTGAHSLFIDTIRHALASSASRWKLGHVRCTKTTNALDLLKRSVLHGPTTSPIPHFPRRQRQALRSPRPHGPRGHLQPQRRQLPFPATQQGYSPPSTWTRGLAWAIRDTPSSWNSSPRLTTAVFGRRPGLKKPCRRRRLRKCATRNCRPLSLPRHRRRRHSVLGIPGWPPALLPSGDFMLLPG